MKETTKKKLIKTAKISGMVMTAFFAVLGLVFSAAALNKCSGGEDRRTPLVTLNESAPKNAYQSGSANVLDTTLSRTWNRVWFSAHTDSSVSFTRHSSIDAVVKKYVVPAGTYYLKRSGSGGADSFSAIVTTEQNNIDSALNLVSNASVGDVYSAHELTSLEFYGGNPSLVLKMDSSFALYIAGWELFVDNYILTDLMKGAPLYSVNWGFQWFPWQMMGYAGSNPVILSDISGSIEDVHVIEHRYLDGFFFRSNGKLYKKVDFMYSWASGSELTDGSGKFYTVSNANAWYIQEVRYYYGDGADDYDVVARFSVFESPTNHYNIPAYGPLAWISPAFRQIDIVSIIDDTAVITTNTGSYTLSQWIEILLQPMSGDININVIQGGDPFSLMTTAFDSMKGILSIAVLPGISLGLLLFLPIIAGIIVIILRVVKR